MRQAVYTYNQQADRPASTDEVRYSLSTVDIGHVQPSAGNSQTVQAPSSNSQISPSVSRLQLDTFSPAAHVVYR